MTSYVNIKSNNTISLYVIIFYDFCVPITWKNILKICRTSSAESTIRTKYSFMFLKAKLNNN